MAKYTVELRKLIDSGYNLGLAAADYPIFDETYRAVLNAKILAHYKFQEIGFETAGRFKHFLNTTLNEIMPYYNQLYTSALLTFNPLHNMNLTETNTRENSSASENTSDAATSSDQNALNVDSDMPASLITAASLAANVYASKANRGQSTTENTDHNTQLANASSFEAFVRTVAGSSGMNPSEALDAFRRTFLNIDQMIIKDLATCFMGVW